MRKPPKSYVTLGEEMIMTATELLARIVLGGISLVCFFVAMLGFFWGLGFANTPYSIPGMVVMFVAWIAGVYTGYVALKPRPRTNTSAQ